ncbi:MAG: hypothetical protein OXH70_20265 [Acidobacteria bacterium]|nr:hypothetical protein [Acidobacteriota bacterium]
MKVARDFVGSPANILGSETTKHGEIAEQVHVALRRAREVLHGRTPTASFDGIPRTGPVDYREAGLDVQSKYCNGLRNTLDRVTADAEKYPEFASRGGRYHIPRDQHRQLDELRRTGGIDVLSDRSADSIQRKVDHLERMGGRSADDLIEAGETDYSEVQRGRVHETLREREGGLARENEELRQAARRETRPIDGWIGQGRRVQRRGWRRRCLGASGLGEMPGGKEPLPGRVLDPGLAGRRHRDDPGRRRGNGRGKRGLRPD